MEEVPFEDRSVPKVEIDWDRSAWWWYPLTRAIHPAMRLLSLVVSLLAVLAIEAVLVLGAWLFNPGFRFRLVAVGDTTDALPFQYFKTVESTVQSLADVDVFGLQEIAYFSFSILGFALIASLSGGVLARRAAVELGQRTMAAWGESIRIVFSRTASYLWAVGMHLVAVFCLLIPVVIAGLIGQLGGVAQTISGVLLILCFPLLFAFGKSLVSAIVGFPLSVAAISVEKGADAFEGFSRSNAYLFQRPVVTVLCAIILGVIGIVGQMLVYWTTTGGWWLLSRSYMSSSGILRSDYLEAGAWLAAALIAAYSYSYFWSAASSIYLILRKSVDNTELDHVDSLESPAEATLPEIPPTPSADLATNAASNQAEADRSTEKPVGSDSSDTAGGDQADPDKTA